MKLKKFLALILAAAMIFGMAGCSGATPATDFEYRYDAELGGVVIDGYTGSSISVKIPAKIEGQPVVSIGNGAFYESGIMEVTIPNGVTTIGANAFKGSTGLTSIVIPDSVASVGAQAFYYTAWYENQPDEVVYTGRVAYQWKDVMPLNTEVEIKEGTAAIADKAFRNQRNLTNITLPDGLSSIGSEAFQNCTGLTNVSLPDSVTSIGYHAFWGISPDAIITHKDVTYNAVKADGYDSIYDMPFGFYYYINRN